MGDACGATVCGPPASASACSGIGSVTSLTTVSGMATSGTRWSTSTWAAAFWGMPENSGSDCTTATPPADLMASSPSVPQLRFPVRITPTTRFPNIRAAVRTEDRPRGDDRSPLDRG